MRLSAMSLEIRSTCSRVCVAAALAFALGACRAPAPAADTDPTPSGAPAPQPQTDPAVDVAVSSVEGATAPSGDAASTPAASQPDSSKDAMPANFRVVGTEPFWGIRIEGDRLHFTTMEDQAGKRLTAAPTPRVDGVGYAGEDGGQRFDLRLTRTPCSDGMSDRSYAYTAAFSYAGTDYQGCADDAAKF